VLGLLLGLVLGLLAVEEVEPLGLEELVDLGAGDGRKRLLGEGVADGLAVLALPLLPQVHRLEGGPARYHLVRPLGLVRLAVVDLVARVLGIVWLRGAGIVSRYSSQCYHVRGQCRRCDTIATDMREGEGPRRYVELTESEHCGGFEEGALGVCLEGLFSGRGLCMCLSV